ncbi:MAG: glycosyltransferase family 2 protein [Prevotella sp.]
MEEKPCEVSVIIPIYGVEHFIGRCAESLMLQTLKEGVEFLFVDDATPDGSIGVLEEVLARHPERQTQVRFLRHTMNLGLPAARNTGLAEARGTYVFHCDSDDYVEADMLETLYDTAVQQQADMVWCDWYLTFADSERYMKQPQYGTAEEALKAMLAGGMKYNVWNKLVRRSLYTENHILFPAGYGMGEDMTMMRLAACARKVAYVPRAFYHYVKTNVGSFCQTYSERHLRELQHNVSETAQFLLHHCGKEWEREVAFLKLEAKFPFLISDGTGGEYRRWKEWYPEANAYIMQNRFVSLRSRMVQWLAAHGQMWAVWLYNKVVMQWMYKLIYR